MGKVSWQDVYNNFKLVYPKLSRMSLHFVPYGYMTIAVYLFDGTKMIYDDLMKRARMVV